MAVFERLTNIKINRPTSMTTSKAQAMKFATNDGMVFAFKRGLFPVYQFDCSKFSDYPVEQERLFMNMRSAVSIVEVLQMNKVIYHHEWFGALKVFENIFINGYEMKKLKIAKSIWNDIKLLINLGNSEPDYILANFEHVCRNATRVYMDLSCWTTLFSAANCTRIKQIQVI